MRNLILLLTVWALSTACTGKSRDKEVSLTDSSWYKNCNDDKEINQRSMSKSKDEQKGPSKKGAMPKSATPKHDSIKKNTAEKQIVVGIGVPVSPKEMEKLKE